MLARKIILGFGFAALLPMLIHYGIDVVCPWPPEGSQYYRELSRLQNLEEEAAGEQKTRLRLQREQLQAARETQQKESSKVHFFVGTPLGILVTLLGSFIRAQAIGGGLMLGGIFTFTGGCFYYWDDLPRLGRFLVLLVAFIVLMWIGYQRLSELKQPAKRS